MGGDGEGSGAPAGAWPVAGWALAALFGVAAQLAQPVPWPHGVNLALIAVAAAAGMAPLAASRLGWRVPWRLAVALALAALAAAAAGSRAQWRLDERLASSLEGQDLRLTGVVADLPRELPDGVRFAFEVESATLGAAAVRVPPRVSLGWYRGFEDEVRLAEPFTALRAGQRWQFTVRLKRPHGLRNPHGFDFELWALEEGIGATGHVRATAQAPARLLDHAAAHPVERARQAIRDAIAARVPDARTAGVLAALTVGDQAAIERADWDLFRDTGIAHLVSISGLHVTMFAWLAGSLASGLWRRSAWAVHRLPAVLAGRWLGLAAAVAYALLAGWGLPAQRTVAMIAATVLLATLGLRWPAPLVLLVAAACVVAGDPWALLAPGFWLSFVAVGLLLVAAPESPAARRGWRAATKAGLRSQAVATVGLAPLSLMFFQQVSLVGALANLLAIPLVTLLVTPLALLGVVLPPLWSVAGALVQALVAALQVLAQWSGAVWTAAAAPPWAQAAALLGGALAVLPLPRSLRLLAVPLLLPLLWPSSARPPEGRFELLAADVGQGSAVAIVTRTHVLLHDAGPQFSRDSDAGTRVLVPLLRGEGWTPIDLLMLSHRDSDHVGGAPAVMAALPVRALSSSLEPQHPLRAGPWPHGRCEAGQAWTWDGVQFRVLHPTTGDQGSASMTPNALSCVLLVSDAQGRRALLTGDLEAAQEDRLVRALGAGLRSDVLLVPHHGSATSSSEAWLDAVQPRLAVVQHGYRNRFGHPAPAVMARYAERAIAVVRSDRCGAWRWRSDTPPGAQACERTAVPRYWQDRPFPP
ncbi:MAG TPA: DNA internalization-related competence protein ComEC/Rec2 [Burkholderiaceae bacterium]|nr:DNA internalization-related competence protein ComEC/Rec2 [Burkholderiaceae bacterium]